MDDKILIFDDIQAAEKEITAWKEVHKSVLAIKSTYDDLLLNVEFSKDLFLELFHAGTEALNRISRESVNAWFKGKKAPVFFNNIKIEADFTDIQDQLKKLERFVSQKNSYVNINEIRFEGSDPIFDEADENNIREKHKYYAITPVEKELYELVKAYCDVTNRLESAIKKNGYPSLHAGLISVNGPFYVKMTDGIGTASLEVNPYLPKELEALKRRRNMYKR